MCYHYTTSQYRKIYYAFRITRIFNIPRESRHVNNFLCILDISKHILHDSTMPFGVKNFKSIGFLVPRRRAFTGSSQTSAGIFYLLFRFRLRLFAIHMLDLFTSLHRFLQQIARRKRDDRVIVIRHRQKRFRVSTHTPLMHFHIKGSKAPNDNTLSLDNGIRNNLKNIVDNISALRFSIAKIIEFIYNINFLYFSSTFLTGFAMLFDFHIDELKHFFHAKTAFIPRLHAIIPQLWMCNFETLETVGFFLKMASKSTKHTTCTMTTGRL